MSEGPALQLHGVGKRYGFLQKRDALEGVSIRVERGECYGLAGPNGAGKTTLIRILLGMSVPDSGEVRLLGREPTDPEARRRVGFVPEAAELPPAATPRQLVRRFSWLRGADHVEEGMLQLERLGMGGPLMDRAAQKLSKGERQRTVLALALMSKPELLVLDEPTDGLDPMGRALIRRVLREEREKGRTVFLNSHLLSETERICSRVGFLHGGRLVREDAVREERRDEQGTTAIVLAAPLPAERMAALELREAPSMQGQVTEAGGVTVAVEHKDLQALNEKVDALRAGGALIVEVRRVRADLEASFEAAVSGRTTETPAEGAPPGPAPAIRPDPLRPIKAALVVAREIGADLASRRIGWMALGLAVLIVFGFLYVLQDDMVGGAAAVVRRFGMGGGGRMLDDALAVRFLGRWAADAAFWGMLVGTLALSTFFAPPILDPRRTILVLAQPIGRGDLAAGIWTAVTGLGLSVHLFLVTLLFAGLRILGLAVSPRLLLVPLVSTLAFSAIYVLVLASAYFARNALPGAIVAIGMLIFCGIVGGSDRADTGWRAAVNAFLPKIVGLSRQAMRVGGAETVSLAPFAMTLAFTLAVMLVLRSFVQRMDR